MPSILETDGYKFSMAEAGFPLRDETFYYSHRKGGWQFLPIDVEDFIQKSLPTASPEDYAYLDSHGYFQGGAFRQAITLHDRVRVTSLPKGAWFYDREPVFSVHGPSALVSWLEPVVLQINFRIQVATCALLSPEKLGEMVEHATCEREREIIRETLDTVGVKAPPTLIRTEDYTAAVLARAKGLVDIVGDANRLFEVGMRAVTCHEQHVPPSDPGYNGRDAGYGGGTQVIVKRLDGKPERILYTRACCFNTDVDGPVPVVTP